MSVCVHGVCVCMCVCCVQGSDLCFGGGMGGQKKERRDTGNLNVVFNSFPQIGLVTYFWFCSLNTLL